MEINNQNTNNKDSNSITENINYNQILNEATGNTKRRKEVEKLVEDVMNILDKTGQNTEKYKKFFKSMSDQQFDKWIKAFLKDDSKNFYLEVFPFKSEPTMKDIKKAAEFLKVPLDEYVYMPYANENGEPLRTIEKVPVGYLHIKRMQQILSKKNTFSLESSQRNAKTGQVIGHDKNGRVSDAENFALTVLDANYALKEFMGARSDDMTAKAVMEKEINTNGFVSLNELPNNIDDKQALNTLDVYFLGAGIVTDLITPGLMLKDTLNDKKVKTMPNGKYNK